MSRIECDKYNDNISVVILSDITDVLRIEIILLVTFNEMEKRMWWEPLPSELKDDKEFGDNSEDERPAFSVLVEHRKSNLP